MGGDWREVGIRILYSVLTLLTWHKLNDDFGYTFVFQDDLIYPQTMNPSWLETHASCIDSPRTITADQLTFNVELALLKISTIPVDFCQDSLNKTPTKTNPSAI